MPRKSQDLKQNTLRDNSIDAPHDEERASETSIRITVGKYVHPVQPSRMFENNNIDLESVRQPPSGRLVKQLVTKDYKSAAVSNMTLTKEDTLRSPIRKKGFPQRGKFQD